MTINIGHLYYDILNLYGASGDVKAMKKYLEKQNIRVSIKFFTIDDEINLDKIDILYIGGGTENNQNLVLDHLKKYKDKISEFIENGKLVIATNNALELFGKTINNQEALGIFDFNSTKVPFRIVDEALLKCSFIKEPIIGFQNQGSIIKDIKENNLFKVIKGTGDFPKSKYEGYHYKSFYGTYLIGPILARNPAFLTYLMDNLIRKKKPDYKIKKNVLEIEEKAFQNFITLYYNNIR